MPVITVRGIPAINSTQHNVSVIIKNTLTSFAQLDLRHDDITVFFSNDSQPGSNDVIIEVDRLFMHSRHGKVRTKDACDQAAKKIVEAIKPIVDKFDTRNIHSRKVEVFITIWDPRIHGYADSLIR